MKIEYFLLFLKTNKMKSFSLDFIFSLFSWLN